ncbi:MAG: preprotein translocase subunit SecG [Victivallales bacterium]|nr:preprotein translocase subunit SecG [Victivallales bacterium]
MGTISVILAIVSVITALLLTIVILIQNPKGQGGIGAISGGVSEAMFGASAPSALVKITVVLAFIFLISTLFYAAIVGHQRESKSLGESITAGIATTPTDAIDAAEPVVEAAAEATENAAEAVKDAAEAAQGAAE